MLLLVINLPGTKADFSSAGKIILSRVAKTLDAIL
jgi:hypothetical protein